MGKLKVRVKEKRLLVDPETDYRIDFLKPGKVLDDVPDNQFWRGKCNEGYLELLGEIDDDPYAGMNVTQLKNLAKERNVKLDKDADKEAIKTTLAAANVFPQGDGHEEAQKD